MSRLVWAAAAAAAALAVVTTAAAQPRADAARFTLRSPAFANGGTFPLEYTCDGGGARDVSSPLAWTAPPRRTRSLALVLEDLSSPIGSFPHWLVWGLRPGTRGLGEGKRGPIEGENGAGDIGYLAPCPEFGAPPHRYRFRLYALDTVLRLRRGADREQLLRAMRGHVVATAQLTARYAREVL